MSNNEALNTIFQALQGYCEDCISTDKTEQIQIYKAFKLIDKQLNKKGDKK
jgi:hypothetical protein